MQTYKRYVLFVTFGVCLGMAIWFMFGRATAQDKANRPRLTAVPQIKTCVEHVKLVKAELQNRGEGVQVAVLELENQAYVDVTAISLETIVDKSKYSVVRSGFSPDKEPLIIIPARERASIEIGNLAANSPIQIASVMFSDGTEEGCAPSVKTMREIKDRNTKKGGLEK